MHKQDPPFDTTRLLRTLCVKSILYNCDIVKPHTAESLGDAARKAVMMEISATPKPGLVDRSGNGCHADMNFDTFVRSADALSPFWEKQAKIGLDGVPASSAMRELRPIGQEMECAMFAATNGINTHKGLIYHLSLLLYGTGALVAQAREPKPQEILHSASLPVKGVTEKELLSLRQKPERALTNGEKLFLRHGVTGARGEAEKGFPSVMLGVEKLVSSLTAGASINDASLAALLSIMETCEDSNVIHRGGYDFWNGQYKKIVQNANNMFNPAAPDYRVLEELENLYLPLRISPGGAADLLCCSLFVAFVTFSACQH